MPGCKQTVWIIEDEPLALDMLMRYVFDTPILDLSVIFNNPADLQAALDNKMSTDIIFMDLNIGAGKALDQIPVLQRHCHTLILTTAYFPEEIKASLNLDWTGVGFLHKPFTYPSFLAELRSLGCIG